MLRWLKQVNANGQKEDFCAYYDQVLTPTQREVCIICFFFPSTHKAIQSYNKEAKQLVSDSLP